MPSGSVSGATDLEADPLTQSVGSVTTSDSTGSFSSDSGNGPPAAPARSLPSSSGVCGGRAFPGRSPLQDDPSKHITALAAAQRSAWHYVDTSASDVRLAECDSETIFRQLYISSDYRAQYGSRCPTPRSIPQDHQRTSPEAVAQARAQMQKAEAQARAAASTQQEHSPSRTTPLRPSGIGTGLAAALPGDAKADERHAYAPWDAGRAVSDLGSGDIQTAYITDTLKRPQGRYTMLEYCIEVEFERASGIICHRYSNFRNLYEALGERFGYERLPLFPGKRIYNLSPAVVNRRTEALNAFLEGIVDDEELRSSEDVRTFLSLETVDDSADHGGYGAAALASPNAASAQ
mmetsp:Transcript_5172/g.20628  ORF Transcript_5172/g.20628 Transcript_5172/m.20628 type:complete len:348 (-) Transcript_5172:84-1127(-)|eukprot:scaffold1199_cov265-Pinguiococcus_pyrenoidosus.AAC.16